MNILDKLNTIPARISLAFTVTLFAMLGITVLGIFIILSTNPDAHSRAQIVFNAVLPLFGTWVGTILAYYFAKENFESATNSTVRLASVSNEEKLRSTLVDQAMTRKSEMIFKDDSDKTKLTELLKELQSKEHRYLPILSKAGTPAALTYRESILEFLNSPPPIEPNVKREDLMLHHLLAHPEFQKPFVTIAKSATLDQAQEKMAMVPGCKFIFVTRTGDSDDTVVGMLTTTDIARYAQV